MEGSSTDCWSRQPVGRGTLQRVTLSADAGGYDQARCGHWGNPKFDLYVGKTPVQYVSIKLLVALLPTHVFTPAERCPCGLTEASFAG